MENKKESWRNHLRGYFFKIREWMRPDPGDSPFVMIPKLVLKYIALLFLIILSPVVLIALAVIFFATL